MWSAIGHHELHAAGISDQRNRRLPGDDGAQGRRALEGGPRVCGQHGQRAAQPSERPGQRRRGYAQPHPGRRRGDRERPRLRRVGHQDGLHGRGLRAARHGAGHRRRADARGEQPRCDGLRRHAEPSAGGVHLRRHAAVAGGDVHAALHAEVRRDRAAPGDGGGEEPRQRAAQLLRAPAREDHARRHPRLARGHDQQPVSSPSRCGSSTAAPCRTAARA